MKTKFLSLICVSLLSLTYSFGQSSSNNNLTGSGKYLGYSGAQNLDFKTNNIDRMRLMQTGTTTINGYTIDNSGFLGLSGNPAVFAPGAGSPFSLLHLHSNTGLPNTNGYRSWMRFGLTQTTMASLIHFGHLEAAR